MPGDFTHYIVAQCVKLHFTVNLEIECLCRKRSMAWHGFGLLDTALFLLF